MHLYQRDRRPLVLAVIAFLVGALLLLVVLARDDPVDEGLGDLTYIEGEPRQRSGEQPALVASIADISAAEVRREDDFIVFHASVAAPPPQPLKTSALEFRWDIAAEQGRVWTLAIAVAKETQASLFSDTGYGAGTVDDTFPGGLKIQGTEIEVRLDAAQIRDFPEEFEWTLATSLRAFRDDPDSPRVEDRYPDESTQRFAP